MILYEQTKLTAEQVIELGLQNSSVTQDLGISADIDGNWWTSYKIGIDNINNSIVEILPKMPNIDFMSLFSYAVMYENSAEYFSKFYRIKWEEETISSTKLYNILTPLLVVQYLATLNNLVNSGLKKDYITIEDNLLSKIKGHILPTEQFRRNTIKKRENRFFCMFQEYSANIPVNRLLKKAFEVSICLIGDVRSKCSDITSNSFFSTLLKVQNEFLNIDSNINLESIKEVKYDKLNRYYPNAIKMAKTILRHYDNSLSNGENENKVPPFWIDMARMFEVYVLGKLKINYPGKIEFQVKGSYYTQCDYLHTGEHIIIDAKYKFWYDTKEDRNSHYKYMLDDIREISGYARDEKLLSYFDNVSETPPYCLIIYPSKETPIFDKTLKELVKDNKIEGFKNFFYLGISLPMLK